MSVGASGSSARRSLSNPAWPTASEVRCFAPKKIGRPLVAFGMTEKIQLERLQNGTMFQKWGTVPEMWIPEGFAG